MSHHNHNHSNIQTIPVNAGEQHEEKKAEEAVAEQADTISEEIQPEAAVEEAEAVENAEESECTEDPETSEEASEIEDDDEAEEANETEEAGEETASEEASSSASEESKADTTDWKDAYIRLRADFDNYRKRTIKEQDDVRRRERERVVGIWLDVYDNAERALKSLPEQSGAWYDGFSSLIKQMDKCLATLNIKVVDDVGEKFDPKRHEAIAILPNPQMENNTIMHVEKKGFVYENGDVARVAQVVVVKNPS